MDYLRIIHYIEDESIKLDSDFYYHAFDYNQDEFAVSLKDWFHESHSEEEYRNLFVYMSLAMKYIHDQGYYITSFALDSIELLNNSIKQVKFDQLSELPSNFSDQKKIIHDNIFLSAVLQIGVYANCLQYFTTETMDFLKENFESFSIFLPENDVPYYKGIIERGASVYLSSYVGERKKRDLLNLNKEVSEVYIYSLYLNKEILLDK